MKTGLKYRPLSELVKGDKVSIEVAYKYSLGYWKDWNKSDYEYTGIEKGEYVFFDIA